jgi:predicted Zn finger-like uncharacterized protein
MYSQCPDCQTRFRVTASMLRAARGTVRCGRCGSAFDALERLSDTIPPAAPDLLPFPIEIAGDVVSVAEPAANSEYHFSAADLEHVFVDAGDWRDATQAQAADRQDAFEPAGAGAEPPIVVVDEGVGMEDITLEGERIRIEAPPEDGRHEIDLDSTDELEILRHVPDSAYPEDDDDDEVEREIAALAQRLSEEPVPSAEVPLDLEVEEVSSAISANPAAVGELLDLAAPARVVAAPPPAAESTTAPAAEPSPLAAQRWRRPAEEDEPEVAATGAARGSLAWTLGSLVLAVVLAVQVIDHYRQDLVRHPQLGPPLRAAYERLGFELLPNWDLGSFELRQWGNEADAAVQGRMVVRASLTNRAAFAQPHPILRLELEDRFGATVATRDFEPADYLKNPSQAARLIAPGSSSEAELLLADPGSEAVGYRLDICLRESASRLRCAGGPG